MENDANVAVQVPEQPKNKNAEAFKICFIIGCVLGAPALILCLVGFGVSAIAFLSLLQSNLFSAVVFLLLGVYISFAGAASMVPTLALTGLGIKWNKKIGAIFFAIFAAIMFFMIMMGIVCIVALRVG